MNNSVNAVFERDPVAGGFVDCEGRVLIPHDACAAAGISTHDTIDLFTGYDEDGAPLIVIKRRKAVSDFLSSPEGEKVIGLLANSLLVDGGLCLFFTDKNSLTRFSFGATEGQYQLASQAVRNLKNVGFSFFAFGNASVASCKVDEEVIAYIVLGGENSSSQENLAKLKMAAAILCDAYKKHEKE